MNRCLEKSFVVALFVVAMFVFGFVDMAEAEELPFLYQGTGSEVGDSIGVAIELEGAVGTREARPFGKDGFENLLRVKFSPIENLTLQAHGGMVFDSSGFDSYQLGAEVAYRVLQQDANFVNLSLAAGYVYDYWKVHIPRARFSLWHSFGRFTLLGSSLLEFPLSGNRDEVDMIVSIAGSFDFNRYVRLGAEVMGEDLEGFWEEEEAEGGAKIIAGPTLWLGDSQAFYFKMNVSAVVPATQNTPAYGQKSGLGVLARGMIGYAF